MYNWLEAQEAMRKDGLRLIEIESTTERTQVEVFFQQPLPDPAQVFLDHFQQNGNIWEALVQSAVSVKNHLKDGIFSASFFPTLQQILSESKHLAIFQGQSGIWGSPDPWGYLIDTQALSMSQIILHLPVSPAVFDEVETRLQIRLPKSYRQLLSFSNGIGRGPRELSYICGAGPQRANWTAFEDEPFKKSFHEILFEWHQWISIYEYANEEDVANEENIFQTNYHTLLPFAYTFDAWCFDLSDTRTDHDYPVMIWDHEDRSATLKANNFAEWFHTLLTEAE